MKTITSIIALLCLSAVAYAQSITVEALNYNSTTRDTLVSFPDGDHNEYRKILMHYSMRCKDGLVSTGADRNRGCGEWDYSCNTNVVDSTQVDSLIQRSPDHIISGFSGDTYAYTTEKTYYGKQLTKKSVTYLSGEEQERFSAGQGDVMKEFLPNNKERILSIITKEQIESMGFTPGKISRMALNIDSGTGVLHNLQIHLHHTSATTVTPSLANASSWREVFYGDNSFSTSQAFINLSQDFNWNGVSNIAMMMSYTVDENSNLVSAGSNESNIINYAATDDTYLQCGASGHLELSEGLPSLSTEVTVSMWLKGDPSLPLNSTLFEGVDANGDRQINVHMPWGNSRVYWDCGNDGSGYDRIEKLATDRNYKNRWNHWAFTKNSESGEMKIYLNGSLWHSGEGKHKPMDVSHLLIGVSQFNPAVFYPGAIDDFAIWEKELSEEEINAWMSRAITNEHPSYDQLLLYYDFDNYNGTSEMDQGPKGNNASVSGTLLTRDWQAEELVKSNSDNHIQMEVSFIKGDYQYNVENDTETRLVENLPDRIDQYEVQGSDRVLVNTFYYYRAGDQPVYNQAYNEVDQLSYPAEGEISISTLTYYSKSPMVYELMSFVTPYGINLDLGIEGKTWTFDVTEFGPILKGDKRLFLNRGGQWQEDMDIRFEFIQGTPVRDVKRITQVWPVVQASYGQIADALRYEPRVVMPEAEVAATELKAVVTGHGQQGEFISRSHILYAEGFPFPWDVWTECASNPIFPQGGTWVYDRAGWCPGAPSDVERVNISGLMNPEGTTLNYGLLPFSNVGDSRYIVNVQMIEYGAPNYSQEVELVDIINPSNNVVYERLNPSCEAPRILVRNNGTNPITQLTIHYGFADEMINGMTYDWEGNIEFLKEQEIVLPYFEGLSAVNDGRTFRVELDMDDEYLVDNYKTTEVNMLDHYTQEVIIELKTNNVPNETSYYVLDADGNEVFRRTSTGLNSNTSYVDTLKNMNGCFRLSVLDSGQDGLSWWANNDGSGYIRMKSANGEWYTLEADFGAGIDYAFTAGQAVYTEEIEAQLKIDLAPNPASDRIYITVDPSLMGAVMNISDQMGRVVYSQPIEQTEFSVDAIAELQAGIYQVTFVQSNRSLTRRFVKL